MHHLQVWVSLSTLRENVWTEFWPDAHWERTNFSHIFCQARRITQEEQQPCCNDPSIPRCSHCLCCNTMGIQLNTCCIVSSGKSSQASLTDSASPSGSLRLSQCLSLTWDWTFIQMPKSKAFTSGEHVDCYIIMMLWLSLNHLVYSSLASIAPCPLALSITR